AGHISDFKSSGTAPGCTRAFANAPRDRAVLAPTQIQARRMRRPLRVMTMRAVHIEICASALFQWSAGIKRIRHARRSLAVRSASEQAVRGPHIELVDQHRLRARDLRTAFSGAPW